MNIFALSDCPVEAAQWQHDKHVAKMTLETAQMLSTAVRFIPPDVLSDHFSRSDLGKLYKTTHFNHPCSKWARASLENFHWLARHGCALGEEFKHRFKHDHKSNEINKMCFKVVNLLCNGGPTTPFATAMPERYKVDNDPVTSYRYYYIREKIQSDSKWTDRRADLPDWLFKRALLSPVPTA